MRVAVSAYSFSGGIVTVFRSVFKPDFDNEYVEVRQTNILGQLICFSKTKYNGWPKKSGPPLKYGFRCVQEIRK